MSTISNISALSSTFKTSSVSSSRQMEGLPKPPDESRQGKDGGGLLGAIDKALKSAGISDGLSSLFGKASETGESSTTNSTEETSSTEEGSKAALDSFLQNLMSALQSQSDATSTSSTASDSEFSMSGMPPPPPPGGMGYGGQDISDKLQSLISSLSSDSSDTASEDSSSDSTSLESSFANLMSALGSNSSSNVDLASFLEALSSNLQDKGWQGNLISTQV